MIVSLHRPLVTAGEATSRSRLTKIKGEDSMAGRGDCLGGCHIILKYVSGIAVSGANEGVHKAVKLVGDDGWPRDSCSPLKGPGYYRRRAAKPTNQ